MTKEFNIILTMIICAVLFIIIQENPEVKQLQQGPYAADEEVLVCPAYDFNVEFQDFSSINAHLIINYPNITGKKLNQIKLLLPANIIYGKKYIQITALKVNDQYLSYSSNGETITIPLPGELAPGNVIKISLNFTVKLPAQTEIFGTAQGMGMLSNWYPVVAPYNIKQNKWEMFLKNNFGDPYYYEAAKFKGVLYAPEKFSIVTPFIINNGVQGKQRWLEIDSKTPARDFSLAYGVNLKEAGQKIGNMEIKYYYQKNNRSIDDLAVNICRYYSQILQEYRYNQLILVDVPIKQNIGMEFSGIIFLSTFSSIGEKTVAHEIAHQYWYGIVGSNQIMEPWIDEGLATYLPLLYLENEYGKKSYDQEIKYYQGLAPEITIFQPITGFSDKGKYKYAVYNKAALFWDELRRIGGKEKMISLWNEIIDKYQYRVIEWSDIKLMIGNEYDLPGDIYSRY